MKMIEKVLIKIGAFVGWLLVVFGTLYLLGHFIGWLWGWFNR